MYNALGTLTSTVIHAALQHAGAQHLEELQFGTRQLTQKRHALYELNETLQQLYLKVSGFPGNAYLLGLTKQLLDFLYLPYAKKENSEETLADNRVRPSETLAKVLLIAMQNSPFMMKETVHYLCEITKKDSACYLGRIRKGIHPQGGIEFEWYTGREVSPLYMKTTGSIVKDTAENRYPDGHLLNLEQPSERYAVSLRTIRRIIKFLNDLQLMETRNGLGSRIVYPSQQKISSQQQEQLHPLLDYYIYMLELAELLIKTTLSVYMEHCTWKKLEDLAKEIQEKKRLSSESVLLITKYHENPCIYNIVEQFKKAISGSVLIRTLFGYEVDEQTQQDMKSLCQTPRNREQRRAIQLMQSLLHNEAGNWKMKRY